MCSESSIVPSFQSSLISLTSINVISFFFNSYTFFLDYQGDVLICPHDWGKKRIIGDFNKKSLKEIWLSKLALSTRKTLLQGNRNFEPCKSCDVEGTLIGKKHAILWEEYYGNK